MTGFRRVLSLRDALGIVVGAIVGVGIFFTPGKVASHTGDAGLALLAWGIGGGIALLGALTFAELGGLYPRAGGQYAVLSDAYGAPLAFVYGFCLVSAIQAGATAIIGIVCAQHLGILVTGSPPEATTTVAMAALMIVGLGWANVRGVRLGASITNVTTLARILTLVGMTLMAFLFGPAEVPSGAPPGPDAPAAALLLVLTPVLFSFGGWQQGLWMAGEIREPRRNVPLAIVLGVMVVVLVYLLANLALFRMLGSSGVAAAKAPAAAAMKVLLPGIGERVVGAAVAVSAFGIMNAQLLTGPRYIHAMARDGRFFAPFARLHARHATPHRGVVLLALLSLILLFTAGEEGLDHLLTGVVFIDWVFFGLTGAALLVLRRKLPDAERPVRVPAYPFTPLLFTLAALFATTAPFLDPRPRAAALIGLAWIAAAVLTYLLFFRGRR